MTTQRSLNEPVGRFTVDAEIVPNSISLGLAAEKLAETGRPLIVVQDGKYFGLVSEANVLRELASGRERSSGILASQIPALPMSASGAEALRWLEQEKGEAVAVVDALGHPVGLVTPSSLIADSRSDARPRMVGGMATPFGVYLTNGAVSGGVGGLALVATGMLLFTLFVVATAISIGVGMRLQGSQLPEWLQNLLIGSSSAIVFLAALRFMPLSGYHAAEHMTVHAIERGEELEKAIVRRMPRVHPRCGTNLAVGATLFLSLATMNWIPNQELKLLAAALVSLSLWRPVGSILQQYVTTKPPNEAQLDAGVRAGKQLLERYERLGSQPRGILQKLALSGMFHIMLGSLLVYLLLQGLLVILPIPDAWKVYF